MKGLSREEFHQQFTPAFKRSKMTIAQLAKKTWHSERSIYDWLRKEHAPALRLERKLVIDACRRRTKKR